MAWESATATFECCSDLSSLLIIHTDFGIFATRQEVKSILLVIRSQQLVHGIVDSVKGFTGCCMEVEQ